MGETRIIVDHLRLNYTGPFEVKALYKLMTSFWKEKGFDFQSQKEFEHHLKSGKHIEWQLRPWKQVTHNVRHIAKMRVLIYDYKKVDAVVDKKKKKIGQGRVVIYLDGYIDLDQWNIWENRPILQFIRSIYLNFVFKMYTERFEQRLAYDFNHLYNNLERFFNLYKHYKVVSKVAPFARTG